MMLTAAVALPLKLPLVEARVTKPFPDHLSKSQGT